MAPGDEQGGDGGPIRVLIADDHEVLVETLTLALTTSGMEVVGHAGDGPSTLAVAAQTRPDVVLLDLRLGGEWGLDLVPELRNGERPPQVVVFSAAEDADLDRRVEQAGACGRVHKGAPLAEILSAVRDAIGRS